MKTSLRVVARKTADRARNSYCQSLPHRCITTYTSRRQSNPSSAPAPSPAPSRQSPPSGATTSHAARPALPTAQAAKLAAASTSPPPPKPASASAPKQPPIPTQRQETANPPQPPITDLSASGLSDQAQSQSSSSTPSQSPSEDWTTSFSGLSSQAFSKEAADILLAPLEADDVEIKPDGILYLPEIKYRRILNRAFGPGGWGLAPRGETIVTAKCVTREYALVANGRLVSIARGEQDYFDSEGIPTATEGCKSNALMRCCKDLGVASELWDPRYIRKFMAQHIKEVWVEHVVSKKKKKIFMRKDDEVKYPFKESKGGF